MMNDIPLNSKYNGQLTKWSTKTFVISVDLLLSNDFVNSKVHAFGVQELQLTQTSKKFFFALPGVLLGAFVEVQERKVRFGVITIS